MKILAALSLTLLFALPAAADCLEPTKEELPRCRGTVMIHTPSESGTGLAIGYEDDEVFVLTARHVVGNAKTIEVQFYDKKSVWFPARLERQHPMQEVDLAVIRVSPTGNHRLPTDLPKFSVREDVTQGLPVVIISGRDDLPWQMDLTIINRRSNKDADQRMFHYKSENLKPGISGGPIFDLDGFLLGMAYVQPNGNDGEAVKISQFLDLLNMNWGVAKLLTNSAETPLGPGPSPRTGFTAPTIEVELKSILVLPGGGGGAPGWSYQVFLAEEEKLSEGRPRLSDAVPVPSIDTPPPYALTMTGKKREVGLSREDRLVLKVIATGPDARRTVEGQATIDFSNFSHISVGLTMYSSASAAASLDGSPQRGFQPGRAQAPAKGVFTFFFSLKKVRMSFVISKNPHIETMRKLRGDLSGLIAEGEKIMAEADVKNLRGRLDAWRKSCGIVLDALDDLLRVLKWQPMMRDLKGLPVQFKAGFEAEAGMLSEDVGNLGREELLTRVWTGVKYLDSVVWKLRDDSPSGTSPRPGQTDAPQTPTTPKGGSEPPLRLRLSGGGPTSRRSAAALNHIARR